MAGRLTAVILSSLLAICGAVSQTAVPKSFKNAKVATDTLYTTKLQGVVAVDVRAFGLVGDGTTNDTPELQRALDSATTWGLPLVIQPLRNGNKTFLVDPLTITSKVHIVGKDGASLKLRGTTISTSTRHALLKLDDGSTGSIVDGLVIDGNRNAVKSPHIAVASSTEWAGIQIKDSNVTIRNTEVRNATTTGIIFDQDTAKSGIVIENVRISGGAAGIRGGFADRLTVRNVVISDLYNDSVRVNQHVFDLWDSRDIVVDGLVVPNAGGDIRGASYWLSGLTFLESSGIITNLAMDGVTVDSLVTLAISFMTSEFACSNWRITGWGGHAIELSSMKDFSLVNAVLDGEGIENYDGTTRYGVTNSWYGLYTDAATALRTSTAYGRKVRFTDVVVMGYDHGITEASGNATYENVQSLGNNMDGIKVRTYATVPSFPSAVAETELRNINFVNVTSKYNGWSGLNFQRGSDVTVTGGDYSNNGQDSALASGGRAGIRDTAGGSVGRLVLDGGIISQDNQGETITGIASFDWATYSGAFSANQTVSFEVVRPSKVWEQQRIKVAGIKIKVTDVSNTTVTGKTVYTGTFPTTTTAGTGTLSSSGNVITGSGTALSTEINGPYYIVASGQYRKIVAATSATAAATETAFSPALSGATFAIVKLDVEFIPSQHYGINLTQANPVVDHGSIASGNLTSDKTITNVYRDISISSSPTVLSNNTTNATTKSYRYGLKHYTNSEEPAAITLAQSTSTQNTLDWGGGTGTMNSAQLQRWWIGATNTTLTGIQMLTLNSTGLGIISTPYHTLSMYNSAPTFVLTDTTVNRNVTSAAQATDTASFQISTYGNNEVRVLIRDNKGRSVFGIDSLGHINISNEATIFPNVGEIHLSNDADNTLMYGDNYGTTQSFGIVGRSAGGTLASPSTVGQNRNLIVLHGMGHDGTSFSGSQAAMYFHTPNISRGAWTSTNRPTEILWYTTDTGSTTAQFQANIDYKGRFGVGGATQPFQVSHNGDLTRIKAIDYTFPSDNGDAGEQLTTDGSGNLTWESAGAGMAPDNAQYIVLALSGSLSAERQLAVNTTNLSLSDGGANGSATINTVQNIDVTADPTFAGVNLTGDSWTVKSPNGTKTHTFETVNTGFNPTWLLPTMNGGTFAMLTSGATLAADMALVSDANGYVDDHASVSATEVGYLDGVTSAIQTQLGTKVPTTRTVTINGTASEVTSSAGAQDLSADRTWTVGLPDNVIVTTDVTVPTLYGSSASGGSLTLFSTSHGTKGKILYGTSAYDEVNNFQGVGTTSPGENLHVVVESDFAVGMFDSYGTTQHSQIAFRRARGTVASPAAVQSGDILGTISFRGDTGVTVGTSFTGSKAAIVGTASDNWSTTSTPTHLIFQTTPLSSLTATERVRINYDGAVGIGTGSPKSKMHIEGASGWIVTDEQDTNPTSTELDANDAVAWYTKANKLVFAYNNGGTITYLSIALDGSSTTWVHSTSAP